MSKSDSSAFSTCCVSVPLTPGKLDELRAAFDTVLYHPDEQVPDEELKSIDIWYGRHHGFPPDRIVSVEQVPRMKLVQLSSAGVNAVFKAGVMKTEEGRKQIKVCSSAGMHVGTIPQYIIASIVNAYMKLHMHYYISRAQRVWPNPAKISEALGVAEKEVPANRSLRGKTVGMLGYGHIARETARLLKAYTCTIIAANSNGQKRPDQGYIIPGTGDEDGSIPSEYYSTSDAESFATFLSKCDVVVASMPSTPQTTYMLTAEHFGKMKAGSVFVNVGRGDLFKSPELLTALNAPGGVSMACLDVTDPEPLPAEHELFSHPRVLVTAHISGVIENYMDLAADVLLEQLRKQKNGEDPVNVVDPAKGY